MQALSATLRSLEIGSPIRSGPLALFPLLRADAPPAAYALLDEALDAGAAEVTEVSEGGSVPELLFRNRSGRDVLLVDGEELAGAKQKRGLNLTILVGAFQEGEDPRVVRGGQPLAVAIAPLRRRDEETERPRPPGKDARGVGGDARRGPARGPTCRRGCGKPWTRVLAASVCTRPRARPARRV